MTDTPTTINTDSGKTSGLNKCPQCGSADIALKPGSGQLQCNYCRFVFDPPAPVGSPLAQAIAPPLGAPVIVAASMTASVTVSHTELRGSGAADIDKDADSHVTIKCQGCGAEVVIDTDETVTARCHWCRQMLSLEHQIPNGAVPDIVLPFLLSKEQARENIARFVKKRAFFANSRFKKEFNTENVHGVYLPYFVVDAKLNSELHGVGGHVARSYTINKNTYYDIDVYQVGRMFDLTVEGLTLEANSEKRNLDIFANTHNVINAIMPFDMQNAISYNGNYLKGFNAERRDTNVDDARGLAGAQIGDVARAQAYQTAQYYDAGIRWDNEKTDTSATAWRSAYLPVWLYSYLEKKNNGPNLLHYVAVNARTGETMGSVPVDKKRLFAIAAVIEVIAIPIGILFMILAFL